MTKSATKGAVKSGLPAHRTNTQPAKADGSLPAYMQGKAGQGLKGIDDSDLEMPRVYLLSGVHSEVETYDDAEAGMFWHNVKNEPLSEKGGSLRITPILITKEAILWRPRGDGQGGILARCKNPSDPDARWTPSDMEFTVKIKNVKTPQKWHTKGSVAESGLLEWGSSIADDPDSQPAATLTYRILANFPDHPELGLAVITCSRSSVRPAKKLLSSIRMSGAPAYGLIYSMGTKEEQGPEGPYLNYQFDADGFVDEERFAENERLCKSFMGRDFHGKGEDGEPDGVTEGRSASPGKDKAGKDRY